jgi:coenzyme F420-reducing hydrogenase alpha subunit
MDAGRITLRLERCLGLQTKRIASVTVHNDRSRIAAVLRGKPVDQAVKLVPLLFALCGKAQGLSASLAVAAARGNETEPYLDIAVQAEVMREHAWRLLLDLPPLIGLTGQEALFRRVQLAINAADREAVRVALTDQVWDDILERLSQATATGTPQSTLLPPLSAAQSLEDWPRLTAEFALTPQWRGRAAETGAWARLAASPLKSVQHQNGPQFVRWAARLEELRDWANGSSRVGAGGTACAAPCATMDEARGVGRALVETARGLLMHEISIEDDRIANYVIVAPTEWNFHPEGTLASWLKGYRAADEVELRRDVALMVATLDPCVAWTLELS